MMSENDKSKNQKEEKKITESKSEKSANRDDVSPLLQAVQVITISTPADRRLIDALLDYDQTETDEDNAVETLTFQEAEIMQAWQEVTPVPKIIPGLIPRKRKLTLRDHSESPCDVDNTGRPKSNRHLSATGGRESHPLWKSCVEPTTYRYMPNNGIYRAVKLEEKTRQQTRTFRKQPERLTIEQKILQKEIQRELRKEFENSSQGSADIQATTESADGDKEGNDTVQLDRNNTQQYRSQTNTVFIRPGYLYDTTPISVPLVAAKSAKERIFENFAHRISTLDEEMKNDMKLLRKSNWDNNTHLSAPVSTRTRSEPCCNGDEESMTLGSDSIVDEGCSKRTGKSEENIDKSIKTTRKTKKIAIQKMTVQNAFRGQTSGKFLGEVKNASNKQILKDMSIIPGSTEKELRKHLALPDRMGKSKKVNNLDIATSNERLENLLTTTNYGSVKKKKSRSVSSSPLYSAPITIATADSYNASGASLSHTNVIDPDSLLPEISGKRLEVTVHR